LLGSAVLIGLRAADSHPEAAPGEAATVLSEPTIIVVGHGSAPIVPDTAAVVIGVEGSWPTLEEATRRVNGAIAAATEIGVTPEDVRTIQYRVTPVQTTGADGVPTAVESVQVSQRVGLIVRDPGQLDAVLAAVTETGVTVYGVGVGLGDPSAAAATAREAAMADARAKADQIAASLGVSILHADETIELDAAPLPPSPLALAVADPAAPPPSASGEIKVDIQVTYAVGEGTLPGARLG
jgi:uncharacterized protein YggE